ncbi:MAG: hypothetical protein JO101_04980 [Candidatus Eremiobacteraeota bacterium]|nr:hypothetical protein [Candidatus Eremiobacteraeota bacterium]MBV8354654.1 hypothetical protein [Candidatus Eremiobacteraeota bacterium]
MRYGRFRLLVFLLVSTSLSIACLSDARAQNVPPTPAPPAPGGAPGTTIPLPPTALPTPLPSLTPITGRRGRSTSTPQPKASPSPSETPAPPQFTSLDGTWEIELQTRVKTFYSHLVLKQAGEAGADVSGVWQRGNTKLPLTGTFDGRLFKFVVKDGSKEETMSGYVENFSDIVGMYTDGGKPTPFTAQHRKREKGLDVGPGFGLPAPAPAPR